MGSGFAELQTRGLGPLTSCAGCTTTYKQTGFDSLCQVFWRVYLAVELVLDWLLHVALRCVADLACCVPFCAFRCTSHCLIVFDHMRM